MVVHGRINGYSRDPVFLRVALNNTADTVLEAFSHAVAYYGLPSRVRADHGGENVQIAHLMFNVVMEEEASLWVEVCITNILTVFGETSSLVVLTSTTTTCFILGWIFFVMLAWCNHPIRPLITELQIS